MAFDDVFNNLVQLTAHIDNIEPSIALQESEIESINAHIEQLKSFSDVIAQNPDSLPAQSLQQFSNILDSMHSDIFHKFEKSSLDENKQLLQGFASSIGDINNKILKSLSSQTAPQMPQQQQQHPQQGQLFEQSGIQTLAGVAVDTLQGAGAITAALLSASCKILGKGGAKLIELNSDYWNSRNGSSNNYETIHREESGTVNPAREGGFNVPTEKPDSISELISPTNNINDFIKRNAETSYFTSVKSLANTIDEGILALSYAQTEEQPVSGPLSSPELFQEAVSHELASVEKSNSMLSEESKEMIKPFNDYISDLVKGAKFEQEGMSDKIKLALKNIFDKLREMFESFRGKDKSVDQGNDQLAPPGM